MKEKESPITRKISFGLGIGSLTLNFIHFLCYLSGGSLKDRGRFFKT